MFSRKKKRYGIQKKPRDINEINTEYNQHALQAGHKRKQQAELYEEAERLESEINAHVGAKKRANLEARQAPPAADPTQETQNAGETA